MNDMKRLVEPNIGEDGGASATETQTLLVGMWNGMTTSKNCLAGFYKVILVVRV